MSNTVFCRKYQQELPAMNHPPLPGAKGKEILATVSMDAWRAWIAHQTMLINEYRLSLMEPSARVFLMEELEKYLDNKEEKPAGFTEVTEVTEVK